MHTIVDILYFPCDTTSPKC